MWIRLVYEGKAILGFDPEWSGGLGHLMTVFNVLMTKALSGYKSEEEGGMINIAIIVDKSPKKGGERH